MGSEITTLVNKELHAGEYNIPFDASGLNLSSGVYFYSLKAGNHSLTKKLLLLK